MPCATPEALIFNQPFPFHAWGHPLRLPFLFGSLLITTDTLPATKKQLTSHERVKRVKTDRRAQKLSSLSNPRVHFRQYPPRAVSASGIPRQFGGRSMRRLVGPLSAMLTQRHGPNGERKKPRHGGRDVMAGSISRGLSPLVFFSFIISVDPWLLLFLF